MSRIKNQNKPRKHTRAQRREIAENRRWDRVNAYRLGRAVMKMHEKYIKRAQETIILPSPSELANRLLENSAFRKFIGPDLLGDEYSRAMETPELGTVEPFKPRYSTQYILGEPAE